MSTHDEKQRHLDAMSLAMRDIRTLTTMVEALGELDHQQGADYASILDGVGVVANVIEVKLSEIGDHAHAIADLVATSPDGAR